LEKEGTIFQVTNNYSYVYFEYWLCRLIGVSLIHSKNLLLMDIFKFNNDWKENSTNLEKITFFCMYMEKYISAISWF